MRSVRAFLLGAAIVLLAGRNAPAMTSGELLQSCEAVVTTASDAIDDSIDISPAGLRCWYYMSAIQNMSVVVDQSGEHLLGICAPPDTTLLDYVRIFVRYGRINKAKSEGNAAALALGSLTKAFPCGGAKGV